MGKFTALNVVVCNICEYFQDEMRLKQLRDTQVTSTRERWLDNLVNVVFSYTPQGAEEEGEEEAEPEAVNQSDRQLMDDLEEELRQDRQNLIDRCMCLHCFLFCFIDSCTFKFNT